MLLCWKCLILLCKLVLCVMLASFVLVLSWNSFLKVIGVLWNIIAKGCQRLKEIIQPLIESLLLLDLHLIDGGSFL